MLLFRRLPRAGAVFAALATALPAGLIPATANAVMMEEQPISWRICNDLANTVSVALIYQTLQNASNGVWQYYAWVNIDGGSCTGLDSLGNRVFYYRAESGDWIWGGNHRDCINHSRGYNYTLRPGENCPGETDMYQQVTIPLGYAEYTMHLQ